MSLKYAILGLLTFEPMTGYTLKTRYFDRSVAHFWPADQAQIYRTLQSLEADKAVTSETVEGDTRPGRRTYMLTEKGQADLLDWLAMDQQIVTHKDAFLVQLYFGRLLSRAQLLTVLRKRRVEHQNQARYFDDLKMPVPETEMMRRQIRLGGMTLDFARRREAMALEWLDACIATVEGWDD